MLSVILLIVFLIESTLFLMADSKSGNNDNDSLPSLVLSDDLELLLLSFFGLLSLFTLSALSNLVLLVFLFPVESSSDVVLLLR